MEQVATRRNVLAMATVLGLVAAILVYVYLNRTTTNGNGEVPVVMAKYGIPARTIIAPEMVEMGMRHQKEAPEGAVTNYQDVVGKVAVAGLAQGNVIRQAEIQEKSVALGLAYTIPEGMRAVTVALDPIIGVAGFLKPRDHVDVLATFNINDGTVTKTVLQDVELLATGAQVFQNKVDSKSDKAEAVPNATLAVYPSDAERLILAESKGKLRLALRGVGDVMRASTSGITSRSLIGHVPPDVPEKKVAVASAPASTPSFAYSNVRPDAPLPPWGTASLPVVERKEVEVIKGTQVERVPVKT